MRREAEDADKAQEENAENSIEKRRRKDLTTGEGRAAAGGGSRADTSLGFN